ncbi:DEAD/DEAH box helicase [Jutongia sp.]
MKDKNLPEKIYDEVISEQDEDVEAANRGRGRRTREPYQYFNFRKIRASAEIPEKSRRKAQQIMRKGLLNLESVSKGHIETLDDSPACYFDFKGEEMISRNKLPVDVTLLLSKDMMLQARCDCRQCYEEHFYWSTQSSCGYIAAALEMAFEYLKKHNDIDATDKSAKNIIDHFAEKRRSEIISKNMQQEKALTLEPRIVLKDNEFKLSFKVGNDRLFVIKDLGHFVDLVNNSATETYGSSKVINHGIQNFSEESRKWILFIQDCVAEEHHVMDAIEERTWKTVNKKISALELYGWRIDRLFELIDGNGIFYENRDDRIKAVLKCIEKDPVFRLIISPVQEGTVFQGVNVTMETLDMFMGTGKAYYIDGEKGLFCRSTDSFYEKMEPLLSKVYDGIDNFAVGRSYLQDFYYSVLPEISDYVELLEEKPEMVEQYLMPETKFSFYLDADEGDADCKVIAEYGTQKCSCLDQYRENFPIETYRMSSKELEILYVLRQLFPEIDLEGDRLLCGGDEEKIYDVITHGVEELASLGNVYCTKRFRNVNTPKKPSLNVGVSVSEGMLELELLTQDMTEEELLELLKNYKKQNRYYRFRSGEFIELKDSSLQMLFEMMETMHLTPKEFVKGKMHLPLYRTLYLDKMLEEHSEVYNTRDQQFKSIIKNMKSVAEADYEVPAALDKVMRNYQKNGFRWIKTLESCGFGGILADDMGLGKTLQTIAVLLAAKENGEKGTSLVISPASLVYNWVDEFEKFAPQLKVQALVGKAEERSRYISDHKQIDVLVTSYDVLKRDIDQYNDDEFLYEIIDEAQYIKNQNTAASKAVKLIRSRYRFALTGTPIENKLSELWSIFDYLMPGFLYSYEVFKREFETPIVKNGDEEKITRLQKMVRPFILRRLKQDVLKDLPEKLEETRTVRFDGIQRHLYDAQVVRMKNELVSSSEEEFNKNKIRILAELTRLRQICCDPHLCFENYEGESAKLESCLELIESAISAGHKMLIFSQFTSMLSILEKALTKRNIEYYKITGQTRKTDRLGMVRKFNEDDTPVFLISLRAGGVGLNLTGADVVIHYDPWWNVAVQSQATDRAHRIGQTRKVTVYKMIAKDTIEEKIMKLQDVKKNLADNILNGENVGIGSLSKEELMDLLGV